MASQDSWLTVFDDYVFDAVVDWLENNDPWVVDDGVWAVLLFDSSMIEGGLTKKQAKKDEDIGSFVASVKADRIHAYANRDMLASSVIALIPSVKTVEMMNEYPFLTQLSFPVAVMNRKGQMARVENTMLSFDQVKDVTSGRVDVHSVLNSEVSSSDVQESSQTFRDDGDSEGDVMDKSIGVEKDSSVVESSVDELDDVFLGDKGPDLETGDESVVSGEIILVDEVSSSEVVQVSDEVVSKEEGDTSVVVSADSVDEEMNRRFFSKVAHTEVSSEAFDNAFRDDPFVLPVPSEAGWLNDVVVEETKSANSVLAQARRENMDRLRRLYLELLTSQRDEILAKTDLESGSTNVFARRMEEIEMTQQAALVALDSRVKAEKEAIKESVARERQEFVSRAAASAGSEFDATRGSIMQTQLDEVPARLRRDIQREFWDSFAELKKRRQEHVDLMMDRAVATVLSNVAGEYSRMLVDEENLRDQFAREIEQLKDANRREDIKRIDVLKDDLARDNKLSQMKQEHELRLAELRESFDSVNDALKREYEGAKVSFAESMEKKDAAHGEIVRVKDAEIESLRGSLSALEARFLTVEEEKRLEFQNQIAALNDQNRALTSRLDASVKSEKRAGWISAGLVVAATVVAGLIGAFVGMQFL